MKKSIIVLFYSVLLVCITNQSIAQVNAKRLDSLKTELIKNIQDMMITTNTVGLSIALIDNQDIIWSEGFGYEDQQNNKKATDSTIYRVGSVSKLFTATSVMQLSEQGKINIDDSFKKYIPEFKIKSRLSQKVDFTPRSMMSHQSGLPSDIYYQFFHHNPEPFNSVIKYLQNEYICYQPNTFFSYCNIGFDLLGVLVEKVSNESYENYVKKNLLQKMNMVNSSFVLTPEMKTKFSKAYAGGKEIDEPLMRDLPAAGLYSTVLDLSNFMKMIFNNGNYNGNQIIKAETLNEMLKKQNKIPIHEMPSDIGLGFFINSPSWSYAGGEASHTGDNLAFHSQLLLLPSYKIGAIVIVNTDQGIAPSRWIPYLLLKKYLQLKTGLKAPKIENEQNIEEVKLSKKEVVRYTGDYFLDGQIIKITTDSGKLILKMDTIKMNLTYTNQGYFKVTAKTITPDYSEIIIKKIEGKEYLIYPLGNGNNYTIGYKISKPIIPDGWEKKTGKYKLINDDTKFKTYDDFNLHIVDGYLRIDFTHMESGKGSMIITPISDEHALLEGVGRNSGINFEFKNDVLYFSGLRFIKQNH